MEQQNMIDTTLILEEEFDPNYSPT